MHFKPQRQRQGWSVWCSNLNGVNAIKAVKALKAAAEGGRNTSTPSSPQEWYLKSGTKDVRFSRQFSTTLRVLLLLCFTALSKLWKKWEKVTRKVTRKSFRQCRQILWLQFVNYKKSLDFRKVAWRKSSGRFKSADMQQACAAIPETYQLLLCRLSLCEKHGYARHHLLVSANNSNNQSIWNIVCNNLSKHWFLSYILLNHIVHH